MNYSGDFTEDATVYIMFNTFTSNDPSASCTITNFVNTDVHIHKDDGLTQRNNAAGITVSVDFDGITGSHMIKIDTSDNTVAGFWVVGHEYFVRIEGTTIDGATINSVVGQFSIENRHNEVDVVKWLGQACAAVTVNGVPEVDVTHLAGVAQSLTDLKDLADTGYDPSTHKIQGVVLADTVTALTGHTAQTGDSFARLGAPAGASIAADLVVIDNFVDELESRLSAIRAGYLDNLSAGAVALDSGVDLTKIHGVALTETVDGYLAAAFTKLFDVVTPLLVASDVMRGTDSAALATTALTDVTWTDAKAAFIDHSIATVDGVADGIQTDLSNATDGLGALKALIDTVDSIVDAIVLDTGTDGVVVASGSKTGYALVSTGADLILKDSTFALAIADAIWDEILTGETHNIATSAGRRVREIGAFAIHSGTAQAGNSIHLTLATTASATDGIYNRNLLVIVGGTGNGQTRTIVDYDGTTKIALADREWRISPDATSEYQITPDDTPLTVDHGLVQAATSTTITIRDYASAVDNTYLCNIVIILAGTGRGQARLVSSYNGTTKVITICGDNWVTTPDTDSIYALIPYGASCVGCLSNPALAQINTQCDAALVDYDGPTRTEATSDKDAIITEVNDNETKIDTLQTDSTAIKAKTDNLPSGIAKNVALSDFQWLMVLSSDHVTTATGKTVTGTISKDGGIFSALTNVIAEIGSGLYKVDLTQTEMNADVITLKFTETDCDQRTLTVYTA